MKPFVRKTPTIGKDPGPDYRTIKMRFLNQNRQRLQRAQADLRPSAREFIELLPLLFHVNHPILPGYIDKETPAGLPEYTPSTTTLGVARRLFKSFAYKKRAYRRFHVHSLFMMGSTGTIAYSQKSDFDIWVVYDPSLNAADVARLEKKAVAIERWARNKGVDASLFPLNPETFRQGENGALSHESSGSALHYLLLEEFYRTSILLAGRYPLWWLVPPEEEANYDEYAEQIKRKRQVHTREHVDLGGLNHLKADEFYGATLWLLYKSIHSPYKSVLKIILMESYASEYPNIDLLGVRFKAAVYAGEEDVDQLDPYLMMLRKVEEYLRLGGDTARLELARRSFYFKVDQHLSQNRTKNWRATLMQALVDDWGWHYTQLLKLDRRNEWKIRAVITERKLLIREFTNTYRYLSLFARTKSNNTAIRAADLNILGRKLYAAFERKAGKVEILYKGITANLYESHVSFHEFRNKQGQPYWMVFSGVVAEDDAGLNDPLKRGHCLIELLAWCYFNKIIHAHTVIALYCHQSDLTEKELQLIVLQLCKTFPEDTIDNITIDDMRNPARILAVSSFINVGLDPFSDRTRRGEYMTSNRTDSLKYGGSLENLTLSIDQIIITSWQEVLTLRYQGVEGLMLCIHDYLKWIPPSSGQSPPPINANCFSSYRGSAISRRVDSLFRDIINVFYNNRYPEGTRFILGVEWKYVVLWMEDDVMQHNVPGNYDALLHYLGKPQSHHSQVVFDNETLEQHVLPMLYNHDLADTVQCFYEISTDWVDVYILDERGSLSQQRKPFYDVIGLVKQYQEFFDSIRDRMSYFAQNGRSDSFSDVLFYRIDKNSEGVRTPKQHSLNQYVKPVKFLRLQVIIDAIDGNESLTLFCGEHEFSSLEFGDAVFLVTAKHILSLRTSQEPYPIYITDVDMSSALLHEDVQQNQTCQYLDYKKRIEDKLLVELEKL